jgi:hypothetical protein
MAKSKHYCADCGFHFRSSVEQHAESYHNGGVFRGIEGGDWKDWKRKQQYKI